MRICIGIDLNFFFSNSVSYFDVKAFAILWWLLNTIEKIFNKIKKVKNKYVFKFIFNLFIFSTGNLLLFWAIEWNKKIKIIYLFRNLLMQIWLSLYKMRKNIFFFYSVVLLWCIILTPARIITTLRPSFTTKSKPISDALRTPKD